MKISKKLQQTQITEILLIRWTLSDFRLVTIEPHYFGSNDSRLLRLFLFP